MAGDWVEIVEARLRSDVLFMPLVLLSSRLSFYREEENYLSVGFNFTSRNIISLDKYRKMLN